MYRTIRWKETKFYVEKPPNTEVKKYFTVSLTIFFPRPLACSVSHWDSTCSNILWLWYQRVTEMIPNPIQFICVLLGFTHSIFSLFHALMFVIFNFGMWCQIWLDPQYYPGFNCAEMVTDDLVYLPFIFQFSNKIFLLGFFKEIRKQFIYFRMMIVLVRKTMKISVFN